MFRKKEWLVISLIGLVYVVYILLRAWLLPITHDEGATCLNHVQRSLWDILTYEKDPVPNNHILNTLGIKIFASFLGLGHFSARLPSLIGGVLYVLAAAGLSVRIGKTAFQRVFGMVLLLANPYVTEFFSLARGYGLAAGLMLAAIYFAYRYLETYRLGTLIGSMTFALLAVMANFTLLNFFAPFWAVLLIVWISKPSRQWFGLWPLVLFPLLLALLSYLPVTRMAATDQFRFWGVTSFYSETLIQLLRASLDNRQYLGARSDHYFAYLIAGLSVLGWLLALWRWGANRFRVDASDPFTFAAMIFCGAFLTNMLQAWFLQVPFLNSRTAVFYYPLFAFQLFSGAVTLGSRLKWPSYLVLGSISSALLVNFLICANLFNTYDWGFDANTFRVLQYIREQHQEERRDTPFSLDTQWLEENSFNFHVHEKHNGNYSTWVVMPSWHPDRPPAADNSDFYFTHVEAEVTQLAGRYLVVWTYRDPSMTWWLMRRK
ncbi:MAG: hypothetical protein IPK21_24605 [Haliscomenobacter sp.]|nr:hypothetical protein [Haliscomenobacter sp.]